MGGRYPFSGIPSGWYVVAASDEIRRGRIEGRRYFGRDLVLYRTASGRVVVADSTCPHMGAHLERATVEGETLRCPFHGFRFDPDGVCVGTPYGQGLPTRAELSTWLVCEQDGLVLCWWDADAKPPEWSVPPLDGAGWQGLRVNRYRVASHPQETTENSIDYGHFTSVHNFPAAEMTRPVETDGPHLMSGYAITATLGAIGLNRVGVRAEFAVDVWGLGYSLVNLRVPALGLRGRLFVLPVPVDDEHIELRLASRGLHPVPGLGPLLHTIVHRQFCREVEEDIPIWEKKVYLERPALAPGDGPVTEYRRWARQFYPEPNPGSQMAAEPV